jgi:hypothetical protein
MTDCDGANHRIAGLSPPWVLRPKGLHFLQPLFSAWSLPEYGNLIPTEIRLVGLSVSVLEFLEACLTRAKLAEINRGKRSVRNIAYIAHVLEGFVDI